MSIQPQVLGHGGVSRREVRHCVASGRKHRDLRTFAQPKQIKQRALWRLSLWILLTNGYHHELFLWQLVSQLPSHLFIVGHEKEGLLWIVRHDLVDRGQHTLGALGPIHLSLSTATRRLVVAAAAVVVLDAVAEAGRVLVVILILIMTVATTAAAATATLVVVAVGHVDADTRP